MDGGQGSYGSQKVLERTRYYDPETQLLSSKMGDAGQSGDIRSLRGWIDVEAHFRKKDEVVST